MDTNSKRRAAWRRDEMERRRTERGRQRSKMMEQRTQAANTAYLQRYSNLQGYKGLGGSQNREDRREAVRFMPFDAQEAIAHGETQRQYVTAQNQLSNDEAARNKLRADAETAQYTAKTARIADQLENDRFGYTHSLKEREFDHRRGLETNEYELKRKAFERSLAPGHHEFGGENFVVGNDGRLTQVESTLGYFGPDGNWRNPDGTIDWKPQPQAQQPVRVGGSLVDPATGEEVYREPTEMAEFDEFARNRFRGSDAFPGDGASNEEKEKAYQLWFKKEYPSK